MNKQERDAIRERAEKATKGVWQWDEKSSIPISDGYYTCGELESDRGDRILCIEPNEHGIPVIVCWNPADREVVAHAPEDIIRLLDALEAALEREAKLVEALRNLHADLDRRFRNAHQQWGAKGDPYDQGMADGFDVAYELLSEVLEELGYGEE